MTYKQYDLLKELDASAKTLGLSDKSDDYLGKGWSDHLNWKYVSPYRASSTIDALRHKIEIALRTRDLHRNDPKPKEEPNQ